ncbi:mucin-5AC-like [Brienomyrus brachyistius]|uniref:mucin-5AC-like n=1 Tax=Brienomyrus brachyistius TaxID=42636 RepID=UPI0020B18CF9|nr:mucin-5AC-like [Brienomyrus brachyistius]
MFISVLVVTTPFLFINFPPLSAQTFIPTTQHYKPASHTQSQLTKYMQRPSTVIQHLSMTLPPTDTGALTHLETSSTPLSESKALETTIQPVPETTLLPISRTTLSAFQETESGPQIKNYTARHISVIPAPITTSRPQHFKTSASPTSGPQHFKTSASPTRGPQHFKTSDSPTSVRQHFRTSDSLTSGPQDLNISDTPNSSVSLDKKTHKTDVGTTSATFTVSQTQSTGPKVIKSDAEHSHINVPSNWLWVIIIAIFVICMGMTYILVKLRKKKRSENLRSSFKNGGSYNKNKKSPANDAWAGPMPASGEMEMEEGGEGEEEMQEKSKEGDEERIVLSTFTTIQEGTAEALGGNLGENEANNKVEVPLLQSTTDGRESGPLTASLSSSLLPPVGDDGEGEQDGQAFCLTTAV